MKNRECNGANQPPAWKDASGQLWFPTIEGRRRGRSESPRRERNAAAREPGADRGGRPDASRRAKGSPSLRGPATSSSTTWRRASWLPRACATATSSKASTPSGWRRGRAGPPTTRACPPGTTASGWRPPTTRASGTRPGPRSLSTCARACTRPLGSTRCADWPWPGSCGEATACGSGASGRARKPWSGSSRSERGPWPRPTSGSSGSPRSTGSPAVANRRRFDEALDLEWRRATRSGAPLSLVMLDLDYFKDFNDTNGHLAGDERLRQVAQALAGDPGPRGRSRGPLRRRGVRGAAPRHGGGRCLGPGRAPSAERRGPRPVPQRLHRCRRW